MDFSDSEWTEKKDIEDISEIMEETGGITLDIDNYIWSLTETIQQAGDYIKFLEPRYLLLKRLVKSVVSVKQCGDYDWEIQLDTSSGSEAEHFLKRLLASQPEGESPSQRNEQLLN